MHSVNVDRGLSPKKRSLSRGMSEDESLRSIIKETETPSRRLTRSDSRGDTLKRTSRARSDSQSDPDLYLELPDMLDLQASYEEVVQELRGMEVERETLLFQVDVLQDTLEGVEELLAEAQREAGQASLELERERDARRKLEAMVTSLMEEMERIKEERDSCTPAAPVNSVSAEEETMGGVQQRTATSSLRSEPPPPSSSSSLVETDGAGEGNPSSSSSPTKQLQRMARGKSFEQTATLALDGQLAEDGVLRRPCDAGDLLTQENTGGGGPHNDRDTGDTDSLSTYEDASAETPETDGGTFPPDSEVVDPSSPGGQGSDSETNEKNPNDSCVVS